MTVLTRPLVSTSNTEKNEASRSGGSSIKSLFRGLTKVMRSYRLEIGPVRATGVPAILVAVTGIVLAGGVAAALAKSAGRLPETLREAQGLATSLRGPQRHLNP